MREILESEIRDNRTAVVVHTAVLERATELSANDAAADSATTSRLGSPDRLLCSSSMSSTRQRQWSPVNSSGLGGR